MDKIHTVERDRKKSGKTDSSRKGFYLLVRLLLTFFKSNLYKALA